MNDFKGYVLTKQDINEADALITVFTSENKVKIKVKGMNKINSKNAFFCQPFSLSLFHLLESKSKTTHTLKNGELIKNYQRINQDLNSQSVAHCIAELLTKSDCFSYDECGQFFEAMENQGMLVLCYMLVQQLLRNGIGLIVDECVNCGNTQQIAGISVEQGGFVCLNCLASKDVRLNSELLKCVRYCSYADFNQILAIASLCTVDIHLIELLYLMNEKYGDFSLKGIAFLLQVFSLS